MRRIRLIVAIIVWFFCSFRLVYSEFTRSDDIVTAFEHLDYVECNSIIEASGYCKNGAIDIEDKESFMRSFATMLGVNGDYMLTAQDGNVTYEHAAEACRLRMTYSDSNYITLKLVINQRVDCALSYKAMIEEIFDAEGINSGHVNINLCGEVSGALNLYQRNRIADKLIGLLSAEIVVESRGSELYTIYAYSDRISEHILSGGRKININVAMEYDEVTNRTLIYLSSPINNLDY